MQVESSRYLVMQELNLHNKGPFFTKIACIPKFGGPLLCRLKWLKIGL